MLGGCAEGEVDEGEVDAVRNAEDFADDRNLSLHFTLSNERSWMRVSGSSP